MLATDLCINKIRMKANIIFLLLFIFLLLNENVQAQGYTGTWHLTQIIQDDDILNINLEENTNLIDELTIYPLNKQVDTINHNLDVIFKKKISTINIGRNHYIFKAFDPETFKEAYKINACYCSIDQSLEDKNQWYQFCESEIILFKVEVKNEELHLEVVKIDTWREEKFKQKIYIYKRGALKLDNK